MAQHSTPAHYSMLNIATVEQKVSLFSLCGTTPVPSIVTILVLALVLSAYK